MYMLPVYLNVTRNILAYGKSYATTNHSDLPSIATPEGVKARLTVLFGAGEEAKLPDLIKQFQEMVELPSTGKMEFDIEDPTCQKLYIKYDLNYEVSAHLQTTKKDNAFVNIADEKANAAINASIDELEEWAAVVNTPKDNKYISGEIHFDPKYRFVGADKNNARLNYAKPPFTFAHPIISAQHGGVEVGAFRYAMRNLFGTIAHPIFAIVDHNSAHHMSYALAEKAFAQHNSINLNRRRLILNFDNHADWGQSSQGEIRCNNWAKFSLDGLNRIADIYTHIGHSSTGRTLNTRDIGKKSGDFTGTKWYAASSDKEAGRTFTQEALGFNPQAVLDDDTLTAVQKQVVLLLTYLQKDGYDVDVYITVDRDFMLASFTSYGDGEHTQDDGHEAVMKCMDILASGYKTVRPARFVGFDVTGLPVSDERAEGYRGETKVEGGGKGSQWKDKGTYNETITRSHTDIAVFYAYLKHMPV